MACRKCGRVCFGSICIYCKGEAPLPKLEDEFEVQVLESHVPRLGMVRHMKVRRHDGFPGITWDQLQRLKDEHLGEDVEAIEIYPKADELVNEQNMRHLWELPYGTILPNLSRRYCTINRNGR